MKKVIALIWRIACWKDYAWKIIEENFAWKSVGISSSLRIVARERWMTEARENLIAIWKELAEKYGDGYLAEILVKNFNEDLLIITRPRQWWQIEYLRKNTEAYFIWIEAEQKVRYSRMISRAESAENISFEKFLELEEKDEWDIQNVWKCLKQCDIVIQNNSGVKEFEENILKVSKEFLWKNHHKSS